MDQRKILIKDFEQKITANEDIVRSILTKTGEYLFNNSKKDTRSAAQEDYDAAKKQLESLQHYEDSRNRIHAVLDRLKEIDNEFSDTHSQTDSIERANQPVYEQLGETAYFHLRKEPGRYSQFSDVFVDVNNQIEDIENIENDISSIQAQKKERKFFEKIADTGQVTYLKGIRVIRSKIMPKLYREAGKKLTETNFLDTTGNEEILNTARPYLQNKEKLQELMTKLDMLEKERKDLESELIGLGVDKRAERRTDELERNIRSARQKYEELLLSIAVKVRENPPESIASLKEYKDFIKEIKELEAQNTHFQDNITKLNAAIEVDNLIRQITNMKDNIEDRKRRISEHEQEIENLTKKIAESDAEKKRYEDIRGPEEVTLTS